MLVGIKLNSIAFINMVMTIGLSVDYSVHIGHAYANSDGLDSSKARVVLALSTLGPSVLQGAWTTFLGTCVIALAKSVAFRSLFW